MNHKILGLTMIGILTVGISQVYATTNPYLVCPDCNDTSNIQQTPPPSSHPTNPYLACPDCNDTSNIQQIPPTTVTKIPSWVKHIFIFYGQGQVSEDELLSALKFLIQQGILKIS